MRSFNSVLAIVGFCVGLSGPVFADDCEENSDDDDCVVIFAPGNEQQSQDVTEQTASGTSSTAGAAGGATSAAGAGATSANPASGFGFGNGVPLQMIAPAGLGALALFAVLNASSATAASSGSF